MKNNPPRLARIVLQWFCHAEFIEEVEGDLYELFQQRLKQQGALKAKLHYWLDILHSINPYRSAPRKKVPIQSLPVRDRLAHFFKLAFRNISRSKTSSLINLGGLAVSLAAFMLISLYLLDELTYDSFHRHPDNVYRLSYAFKGFDGSAGMDARAAGLWSVALKQTMPEVKQFTRFSRFGYPGNVWSGNHDHVFVEQQFFWVDSTYTDIFALPLVSAGNAKLILQNPQYIIINEATAAKYFEDTDPVGQTMTYVRDGMSLPFIVGAVMKNYPSNAHFKPDFIANCIALEPLWKRNGEDRINSWGDSFSYSFIHLEPGTDLGKVSQSLQQIFNQHLGDFAKTTHAVITPLRDIHFTPGMMFELEAPGDKVHLYILGSIGLLIIVMACINYMNLATARSLRRSKEVGLRKTFGVNRASLMAQFLGESLIITAIALMIAIALLILFLPSFNVLASKHFDLFSLFQFDALLLLVGAVIATGIISGSYPAFFLSAFRPIEVLRGTLVSGKGPEKFRSVLVVVQMSITLLLLAGSYVIHQQLDFIDRTKLSEYKDQVITVRLGGIDIDKIASYKQLARQDPHVKIISMGPHLPRRENFGNMSRAVSFPELGKANISWDQFDIDRDFITMFNLELVAGREFSIDNPADTSAIVINEQAVKSLGVTLENALGLQAEGTAFYEKQGQMVPVRTKHKVIGVVKDFNYASLHNRIAPVALRVNPNASEMMYIRLEGENFQEVIEGLWKRWKQVYPATPFQHWFMDEEFGRLYQAERQMGKLFLYLAGMAVFIACLGLFGLASFTAEQKTKEIGIRKVLGASTFQVLLLLASRYVGLAMLSFLFGIPVASIAIHSWMEMFAYKAEIGYGFYLWVCLVIFSVTIATVALESLRASRANPAHSIRHE